MIFSFRRHGRLCAAFVLAATLTACFETEVTQGNGNVPAGAPGASDTGVSELLRISLPAVVPVVDVEAVKRAQLVTVDEDVFEMGKAPLRKVGSTFLLRLFDGESVTGIVDQVEEPGTGLYVLQGRLQGVEGGYFILVNNQGTVSATIHVPGKGDFALEWAGDGKHRLMERSGISLPCNQLAPAPPLPQEASAGPPAALPLAKAAAAVPYVDVAVFYTPKALAEKANSVSAMEGQIIEAEKQANLALSNSKVNLRIRVVRMEQVSYTEVDIDTDLSRLQGETDGYMDGIHAVRRARYADLVSLWAAYATSPASGTAYTMDANWRNTGFAKYAFSVVWRKHATSESIFAHELAHNMGCEHNTGTPYQGAYPYSFGHRLTIGATQYRTVMSYAPGTSIPYFSNPAVSYVVGTASAPTGIANVSDNARSLNQLKDIVAAFQNGVPEPTVSAPVSGATFNAAANITVNCSVMEPDGLVKKVEFWRGTTLMGTDTTSPYSYTWNGATSGSHSFTCKAFDEKGASGTSKAAAITVNAANIKTMNPSADARVRDGSYAPTNYGTSNPLEVQTNATAGNNRDSYLKFSLASVTKATSAKLRFYANLSGQSGSVAVTVHDVATTTWIESGTGSITWNNKPARGASRGTFTVANSTTDASVLKWYEVDVTAYVAAQKTAGKADVSFALHNATAGSLLVKANSREASAGKPELRITQ